MKRPAVALVSTSLFAASFFALTLVLCSIAYWRYTIFRNDVDLGIFTQVIAGLGHGFSSTAEGGVNHLLVHWSPIIATGFPFERILGPIGLQYFQAILVAAVLFPIWGLARARFSAPTAVAVTLIASIYPILWANGVGDFHEMAFVPLLSATLVYALDRRRWATSLIAACLLLCVKEDQFAILAANGLLFALTGRRDAPAWRIGVVIIALAIAMALLYFFVVRRALDPHVPYLSLQFFNWPPSGGVHSVVAELFSRLGYLLAILAPLAFLPCLSRYGLFLIPGFVEIFASSRPITLIPGAHYSALLTGYALAAFVDGAARVRARIPRLSEAILSVAAIASIGIGIFASPMEYWYYLYRLPTRHDALLEQTLERLPYRANVGAEDEIFAHLGLDPNASIDFSGQQLFVYDQTHYSQRWHDIDEPAVRLAIERKDYAIMSAHDGIVVLKRQRMAGE